MQLLDGKKLAQTLTQDIQQKIQNAATKPGLAVVIVGENPASKIYVQKKHKTCQKIGMHSEIIAKEHSISQRALIEEIQQLNQRSDIHGILVQLPLPEHIHEEAVLQSVAPQKDVDGFGFVNTGKMVRGVDALTPCTPSGIMELLKAYDIPIEGGHAVVVGRSNIVGKPMAHLLLEKNATVTICHSRTQNIEKICQMADILVVAVGRPQWIKASWIKEQACVIDVGINRLEDGRLVGDVDFEDVKTKAGYITPVPGGVGPLTIAMLLSNTFKAFSQLQNL